MPEKLPPSPLRLRRALAAGDNPLSPFSVRVAAVAVAAALLPSLARVVRTRFGAALRAAVAAPERADATALVTDALWAVAPLLVAAAVAAFAAGSVQTGLPLTPRPRRLPSPLFDARRLVDAARTLLLALGTLAVAWSTLRAALPALASHSGRSEALLGDAGNMAERIAWTSVALAAALAMADVVFQRAAWLERLAPSPEEQRRERRETEGAPEPRRARRRAHQDLATRE